MKSSLSPFIQLIFLDESFAGIDKESIDSILDGVNNYILKNKTACILIEHRPEILKKLSCEKINLDLVDFMCNK